MSHRNTAAELKALRLLEEIVRMDRENRDALPGSVVHHAKAARKILIKLQCPKSSRGHTNGRVSFFFGCGMVKI